MVTRKFGFYCVTFIVAFSYQVNSILSKCVDGNYYSNESDCGAFYQCSNGELIELRCPGELHFNPELNVCDYPENVECGGIIEPTTTIKSTVSTTTRAPTTTQAPTTTRAPTTTQAPTTTTTQAPTTTTTQAPTTRTTTPIPTQPPFDPRSLGMQWSSGGAIAGKLCVRIIEVSDPHTWNDNYLCFNQDYGVRWSSGGTIQGMKCTQILEVADPHTWNDNYLCVPNSSRFQFRWSSNNPIPGLYCIQMLEPADPHTWNDNYLCISE